MKNKSGFILLEVLLSLVILGTVFVFSIQAIAGYTRSVSSSKNINIATALSQQLLTKLNLNEFKTGNNDGNFGEDYPNFSWAVTKTQLSDFEMEYEAVVKWIEKGTEKDFKLITSKYETK